MNEQAETSTTPADTESPSVLDMGLGVAAQAVRTASLVGRGVRVVAEPAAQVVLKPPIVGARLQPATWLQRLGQRGAVQRETVRKQLTAAIDAAVPAIADAIVRRIDVNALIEKHVDLDRIVLQVDLDAVAGRLDVDAVIDRVDLVSRALGVLAEIDLPEIIRESTNSVASDTLRGVRMQTISADAAISRAVDRLLLRREGRLVETAPPPQLPSAEVPE